MNKLSLGCISPTFRLIQTSESFKYRPCSTPPPIMIQVNASKGLKGSTTHYRIKSRPRRKFPGCEDGLRMAEAVRRGKQLYLQKRAKQREQVEKQSALNLEYLEALDVKECMLEIQSLTLGKLAADENHVKGVAEIPGLVIINFAERVKEVEEALTMLKY